MLERLAIRDLAVVERADIAFGPGLNAVTGETGAGKSLLVQAVSLLVGERADSDTVRDGAESAVVEGTFRLAGDSARRVQALIAGWGLEDAGEPDAVIGRREGRVRRRAPDGGGGGRARARRGTPGARRPPARAGGRGTRTPERGRGRRRHPVRRRAPRARAGRRTRSGTRGDAAGAEGGGDRG